MQLSARSVLDDTFAIESSKSVIKSFQIAAQQGQTIYTINSNNQSDVLLKLKNHSASILQDIRNALYANKTIIISEQPIQFKNWQGAGYIILDNDTGAGAYLIESGVDGAATFIAAMMMAYIFCITIGAIMLASSFIVAVASMLLALFQMVNYINFVKSIEQAESGDEIMKNNFGAILGAILSYAGFIKLGEVGLKGIAGVFLMLEVFIALFSWP